MFSQVGQIGHEAEFLIDDADAQFPGVAGRAELDWAAIQENAASVGPVDAREHFHEGRLAGAILSQQGQNLARAQVQIHPAQDRHARKPLVDASQLENVLAHG